MQDVPHYHIETNNYIEAWHHHFKFYYLKLMQKQRLDIVIQILAECVLPDFCHVDVHTALGFQPLTLSNIKLENWKRAEAIDVAELEEMVNIYEQEEGEMHIKIFLFNLCHGTPSGPIRS